MKQCHSDHALVRYPDEATCPLCVYREKAQARIKELEAFNKELGTEHGAGPAVQESSGCADNTVELERMKERYAKLRERFKRLHSKVKSGGGVN